MAVKGLGWPFTAHTKQILRASWAQPWTRCWGEGKAPALWCLSSHTGRRTRKEYTNKETEVLFMIKSNKNMNSRKTGGASLVAQWLRVCLPMQGTWV